MKKSILSPAGLALLTLVSAAPMRIAAADEARTAPRVLTEGEARARAERVSGVTYVVQLSVGEKEPDFTGKTEIRFALKGSGALHVDFYGGTVESLELNGRSLPPSIHDGHRILLPSDALTEGPNELKVSYRRPYNRDGQGLHRFEDPEDKRVYLYTQFETYYANWMFPCFDQPDLKATYKLEVEAPGDWSVVTAARESSSRTSGGRKTWMFPETARFSTYLISLHAGPYKSWESRAGKIPLRLYARKALAKYVDSDEWFKITRQGMEFFQKYFDQPYPFGKYDQVIAPEFNAGAMENVAAVTFSERYIKRGKPTAEEREDIASVVLHEMAHMWFGNLVTMRWWNDLWLNESFATYMSALALVEATEFKDAWKTFFYSDKSWAYWEDELVTTHPIEAPVPDTDQAFANFDGITYGKGASVMKQVAYFLGAEKFRDGVRKYFKDHAFGNAELKDFMGALQAASGADLADWTDKWLRTAGLNTLRAEFECAAGPDGRKKITEFSLVQDSASGESVRRPHRSQVALLDRRDGKLAVYRTAAVTYDGKTLAMPELAGEVCPEAVYPNYLDHDYAKAKLDLGSFTVARASLATLADPMLRLMFWKAIWEMVRDSELSVAQYAEMALENLPKEQDLKILDFILETFTGRSGGSSVSYYLPRDGASRGWIISRAEKLFHEQMQDAPRGSDLQKTWLDRYIRIVESREHLYKLSKLLGDRKLDLDQDRRWAVILRLSAQGYPRAPTLAASEKRRDPSDAGNRMALAAEVARPDPATKRAWFERLTRKDTGLSFAREATVMRNLFPASQVGLRAQFADPYFKALPEVVRARDSEFQGSFAGDLAPSLCTAESVEKLGSFIDDAGDLTKVVIKELKVQHQEDERCVKIRALLASSTAKR